MPDLMADMLKAKIAHPWRAQHAWVPSPTAATLARVTLPSSQCGPMFRTHWQRAGRAFARRHTDAAAGGQTRMDDVEVEEELNNNAQSILGYVCAGSMSAWVVERCRIITSRAMEEPCHAAHFESHVRTGCATGFVRGEQVMTALQRMAKVS